MAAKKETKKTAKKTTKKTTKKSEKILLTYKPIVSSSKKFIGRLPKQEFQDINGRRVEVTVPKIEGLPIQLIVEKDEVIEVTPEQLQQLEDCGFVETEEEYKNRQKFVDNLDPQHPETLTFSQLANENNHGFMSARESNYIYTDKLTRV